MADRLPRHLYQGERACAFTACTLDRAKLFEKRNTVEVCVEYLRRAAERYQLVVPVYCFMPDHLHVLFRGLGEGSDLLEAMSNFKLTSGLWMGRQKLPGWQKRFYDHAIRQREDVRNHVRYIANNPVRAGLVDNPLDYAFTGSIGCDLIEVLAPTEV